MKMKIAERPSKNDPCEYFQYKVKFIKKISRNSSRTSRAKYSDSSLTMSSITTCRLCSFSCCEFKRLYEENGEKSSIYHVAVKYFSSLLLDGEMESTLRVICLECWQHISDFHSFQQWVLSAQAQEDDFKYIIHDEKPDGREDDIVFKCDKCKEVFQSNFELNSHFQLRHSSTCYDEMFDTKLDSVEWKDANRIYHKRRDENSFKCKTCGASFSQYGNLRRHMRKKHAVQPLLKWICKHCDKMFKARSHLERHKNKLHNCKNGDKIENEENCKMDSESGEVRTCKESKTLNHNQSDFVLSPIILQKSEVTKVEQSFKQTSYNTRLSKKELTNDKNESALTVESPLTEKKSNTQIHMPVLDIVDIKNEYSSDEENDRATNKAAKNFSSDEFSSDTEEDYNDFLTKWKHYFNCPKCNQHVNSYSQLSNHFKEHHPEERCYVICCHLNLCDQQSIEEHLQFHENPNAFECADCGKCFKNKRGLSSHKIQVHSDNRSAYHLHLCYCKRAKQLYSEGQQVEYDTFVCCPRKKKILEDDELIAKWKKELICEICKAAFGYYSLMRSHFYHEHPGEKCYILCCQRKMSRISDALQHIRYHLDPHAYRCKICNLDFSGKNTLEKHMRNAHTDSLPKHRWACDKCDKTFEIRQILTRHKNACHSKPV